MSKNSTLATEYFKEISISSDEVVEALLQQIDLHRRIIDLQYVEYLEYYKDMLPGILNDVVDERFIYNTINSDFGKGLILGILSTELKKVVEEMEEDEQEETEG